MNSAHSPDAASPREPVRRQVIAIAGNPNAGKTSLFNRLTGASQQVGNYPGVTVEHKEGYVRHGDRRIPVVDLPGTYSLTAYSLEERVARDFIVDERPALVVDVADASNLERNLYLAVQLMEMRVPLVIALNMIDVAESRGIRIDTARLSLLLGVPVVATVGSRGRGVDELVKICAAVLDGELGAVPHPVHYGHQVDEEIAGLAKIISDNTLLDRHFEPAWLAVKLLEKDPAAAARVRLMAGSRHAQIETAAAAAVSRIERHYGDDTATIIAERRYGVAAGAVRQCVSRTAESRMHMTDRIDNIACGRVTGPVILVAVVAALFFWVFKLSDEWAWLPWFGGWVSPTGLINGAFARLSDLIAPAQPGMPMLHSLFDAALVRGVGGVLGFVPLIFFMFLFISALEDSGYIARVAFILDRLLRMFGMQGNSILALIVSGGLGAGGCAVPGIMATRTLREEKDRLVTMLVAPFMNCGAKMPVYAVLIAAFFPASRTQMMLLLWAISWFVALAAAWALRRFVIRGEQTPFVMELPPYHVPVPRAVLLHTWDRTWLYIKKAGTVILAVNIVLWAFMYFPRPPARADGAPPTAADALSHSMAGRVGQAMEPATQWAGFDWRTNIALIGGFAAKEVVIGALATVYAMDPEQADTDATLAQRLSAEPDWSPRRAFAMMLFVMLYAPCMTTIAVIARESGSWKWAAFATLYSTTIAFLIAVAVYQAGRLVG
jgi:ferrous iron transport protein B